MFNFKGKSFGITKNRVYIFQSYVLDICMYVYTQNTIREMGYSCLGFKNSTDLEFGLLGSIFCPTMNLFKVKFGNCSPNL